MADAAITATFKNKKVLKLLSELTAKTKKISKKDKVVVDILSAIVFRDVMEHFKTQSGPSGRWRPWSQQYALFMQRIGKGSNLILQDSGRLRGSFKPTNYRIENGGITWFNPAKTAKGFPYAAAHDEGGSKLPKRQFMWLSNKALGDFETQIVKFLES